MPLDYVIGCPCWNRSWCLEMYFESIRANVDPARTGLAFVVPPSDETTRQAIAGLSEGFAWVEVMRDKNAQFDRSDRSKQDKHATLSVARNRLLALVNRTKPRKFLSWDSDLLLHPGTVEEIEQLGKLPLVGVWAWLNRRTPESLWLEGEDNGQGFKRRIQWEEPMQATAMQWVGKEKAVHFSGREWEMRAKGVWRADVVLGLQIMLPSVYTSTHYAPHDDGEDVPFNWHLERRGVPRYIYGEDTAVHLYDHNPDEIALGWPGIMALSTQVPLAAGYLEPRSPEDELLGFYPAE